MFGSDGGESDRKRTPEEVEEAYRARYKFNHPDFVAHSQSIGLRPEVILTPRDFYFVQRNNKKLSDARAAGKMTTHELTADTVSGTKYRGRTHGGVGEGARLGDGKYDTGDWRKAKR